MYSFVYYIYFLFGMCSMTVSRKTQSRIVCYSFLLGNVYIVNSLIEPVTIKWYQTLSVVQSLHYWCQFSEDRKQASSEYKKYTWTEFKKYKCYLRTSSIEKMLFEDSIYHGWSCLVRHTCAQYIITTKNDNVTASTRSAIIARISSQWRHNERDGVSNH